MRARTARAARRSRHGWGNCSSPQIAIAAGAGPIRDAINGSGPEFHTLTQAMLHRMLATSSAWRVLACRGSSDSRTDPAANPPTTMRLDANSQVREPTIGHWASAPNATTAAATAAARTAATRHDGTDPGGRSGDWNAALADAVPPFPDADVGAAASRLAAAAPRYRRSAARARQARIIRCAGTTPAPHEHAGCIRVHRPRRACGTPTGSYPRRPSPK